MSDGSKRRSPWLYAIPVVINFSSVLLSFASRILVARLVGPAAFGVFAVWLNNVQLFGTIGTFGQANYVLKELVHVESPSSERARQTAFSALKLAVVAGSVFGLLGFAFFVVLQGGLPEHGGLQWLGSVLFAILITLSAVHRGLGAMIVGVMFDRLVYQILFMIVLIFFAGQLAGNLLSIPIYTAALLSATAISVGYLLYETRCRFSALWTPRPFLKHARQILPFFAVNCLFVANARYLLGYAGIFLEGEMLGQVGLIFSITAMMIIPTSTLNLVVAPILARRLTTQSARRTTLIYFCAVSLLVFIGLLVVFVAHPLIFAVAGIGLTIPTQFVLLLCATMGVTLISNAGLLVEQLSGRALSVAKLMTIVMALKLTVGYWLASTVGISGLLWSDIVFGGLFAAVLLARAAVDRGRDQPQVELGSGGAEV